METDIRLGAFSWLEEQTLFHGDTLPRHLLESGFPFQGRRITLVGPSGIWKPKDFEIAPISITSTVNGPYDDALSENGLLIYRYRGCDPSHRDNRGLQEASRIRCPLIYFYGVVPGRYLPVWPVFIIQNIPEQLCCLVAIDPAYVLHGTKSTIEEIYDLPNTESALGIRRYVSTFTQRRLHQTAFRERVINAYDEHCSLCALKHRELLDAAHIIGDTEDRGDPIVQNGLSLCKIHHAAFDKDILGISPDFRIQMRDDILRECDGPMLKYGLQELHGGTLILPSHKKDWPDRERLDIRYNRFLAAG